MVVAYTIALHSLIDLGTGAPSCRDEPHHHWRCAIALSALAPRAAARSAGHLCPRAEAKAEVGLGDLNGLFQPLCTHGILLHVCCILQLAAVRYVWNLRPIPSAFGE